jgi:hypothetical protein
MVVNLGDCGIVEECLKKHSPVISQHEDSWLTKHLKLHMKSALAVPLHTLHSSKVVLPEHGIHHAGSFVEPRPRTGTLLGVVVAINKMGPVDRFGLPDEHLLEALSATIARALDNNKNLDELFELKKDMLYQAHIFNTFSNVPSLVTLHRKHTPGELTCENVIPIFFFHSFFCQAQQRNLILQGAATLHTSPLSITLSPSAGSPLFAP